MNTRATLQVVMVGIALGGASMAANAIVSSWDFRAFGGFEGPGNDDGFPTPTEYVDVINTDGDYAHFGWGTPTGQEHSHLTINEVDPTTPAGDLTKYYRDNGPPGEIQPGISDLHGEQINQITTSDPTGEVVGWAVHHNFVIGEEFPSGIVRTNFHLQLIDPANPGVVVWDSGELDLTFEVWETPNFIGGPCPPDGDPTVPTARSATIGFESSWAMME